MGKIKGQLYGKYSKFIIRDKPSLDFARGVPFKPYWVQQFRKHNRLTWRPLGPGSALTRSVSSLGFGLGFSLRFSLALGVALRVGVLVVAVVVVVVPVVVPVVRVVRVVLGADQRRVVRVDVVAVADVGLRRQKSSLILNDITAKGSP